jgi:hypothetical protein
VHLDQLPPRQHATYVGASGADRGQLVAGHHAGLLAQQPTQGSMVERGGGAGRHPSTMAVRPFPHHRSGDICGQREVDS